MSLVHVDAMRKIAMTMTTYDIHIKGQDGVTLNQDLEKETEGERREANNLFNTTISTPHFSLTIRGPRRMD